MQGKGWFIVATAAFVVMLFVVAQVGLAAEQKVMFKVPGVV